MISCITASGTWELKIRCRYLLIMWANPFLPIHSIRQVCVDLQPVLRVHLMVVTRDTRRQEELRSQVLRAFLERTIRDLHEHVQGYVVELMVNVDEVGISDWEDCKTKRVIGPPRC
jgi:hypothetical protein